MNTSTSLIIIGTISQLFFHSLAGAQTTPSLDRSCGDLTENSFRKPIDYNAAPPELISNVETHHFPPYVERLERGKTDDSSGSDIAYTLRTFPNHPRALMAMSNLGRKEKTDKPRKSTFTIQCWFQRAIFFRPEDGMVRMVYGIDLMKSKRYQEAIAQFKKSEEFLESNGNLFYNLGLAYFEIGEYEMANEYAQKAYYSGFVLPGLKKKLESKNKWKEPIREVK